MVYHPHVHFVVPGGAVKVDDRGRALSWQATAENFFVHHGTLINVYKAKLADHLRACGLYEQVPKETWHGKFVVDIEAVGNGAAVLKYLAPYVQRVAIKQPSVIRCAACGHTMRVVAVTYETIYTLSEHALAYLDSG